MSSDYFKRWYSENLDRERYKRKTYSRKFREENPERHMYQAAKARAKLKGLAFKIDIEDVVIPDECPILKVPLERGTEFAPSLDRLYPNVGYIRGNVWVISRKANLMKNNATQQELERFAEWVRKAFQR